MGSILICLLTPNPIFSLKTGFASVFGVSNLYLLYELTDYFADSTELNVFAHTWSLGVEEQFYLIFPFLVWWSGFGRWKNNGSKNLCLIVGALAVVSLSVFGLFYWKNQSAAYFLMPTRLWELGTGCLLFIGLKESDTFKQRLECIPPLLPAAGAATLLFFPVHFAVPATIAVVLLTALLIACLRSGTIGYNVFACRPAVFVGLISYSLYLWHWGVLSLSRWTVGIHWWSVPTQVSLTLLLAVGSYRYLERPLRSAQWSAVRWKSISYGLVLPRV